MTNKSRTEKQEQVRDSLPDELKPVFDELVEDYKLATSRRYGQRFVAYIVFADLVRVGWRHTAEPVEERQTEKQEQVRDSLPDELKPVFDELVEDYKFATSRRYRTGVVSYIVLSDLIRVGWRHMAEPVEEHQTESYDNE